MMREFIYGETVHGFLLVAEPVDENIGKSERDKKNQRQQIHRSAHKTLALRT